MKKIVLKFIINNKKDFITIMILFCLGLFLGILFVNNSTNNNKEELKIYIQEFVNNIKNVTEISKYDLFKECSLKKIAWLISVFVFSLIIIGGVLIYIIVILKGFYVGYALASIIAVLGIRKGTVIVLSGMIIHNVIFLISFFFICERGIKLYKNLYRGYINTKKEIMNFVVIMFISIMLSLISALIETFVSANLLIFLGKII